MPWPGRWTGDGGSRGRCDAREALKLLQTVHKHGQGQLAGYEKRVHLDQIIPQKRYQDTYARLKAKYGRKLSEAWVEVTDPGKHVFEDLGIAAFLLELWEDMYATPELVAIARQADSVIAGAEKEGDDLSTTTANGIEALGVHGVHLGDPCLHSV